MRSRIKQPAAKSIGRSLRDTFDTWNREVHYYLGLYLLFFLWLFAFTGLLLNHPSWNFAKFWPNREQSTIVRQIQPVPSGSDLVQAKEVMRQLAIHGEIDWTTTRADPSRLDFRASRPGHMFEFQADLRSNRVTVQRIDLNLWGVMHVLHTFTGVRMADPSNARDWGLTTLWALSMDGLGAGLILMILSSLYMWWGLVQKRRLGLLAIALGVLSCGSFVVGLRWLCH